MKIILDGQNLIYDELKRVKLLPLYTVTDLNYLKSVEEILFSNDVSLIEITFRSQFAAEAIKILADSGKLIVGAGTVRSLKEAKIALENGAQFIVSPAVIPEVIEYCIESNIIIIPGVATPSDIQKVVDFGINTVKFFPANIYGGIKAIEALSGPFYDVEFIPTGGIDRNNLDNYLENKSVLAVGGSFILSEKELMQDKEAANFKLNELVKLIDNY